MSAKELSENLLTTFRIKIAQPGQPEISGILADQPRLIGRSPDADFVLLDESVSRRHARIYLRDNQVRIEDLGSSNGTFVNGRQIRDSELTPSDRIDVGGYSLRIEAITTITMGNRHQRTELGYQDVAPIHEELVGRDHSTLSFLYRLSQNIAPHRSLNALFEVILEEVLEVLPAERGYVLMTANAANLCISKSKAPENTAPPISQTLVSYVQDTRSSVMTSDARSDDRFECSESIAAHKIEAAICVPVISRESVLGVIYIDAANTDVAFTPTHLQVLSIVGQLAGAAAENILLTEAQIHQERLAAIGQTVSATSHDMRNIIVGISGGTELLEMAQEKQRWDRVEKAARIIRMSLVRFDSLVDSLLTCAKKSNLCLEPTEVAPLVREVIDALGHTAEKHGVDINLDDKQGLKISMDGRQIHRVLTNLVRNAIEAMSEGGGTIRVEIDSDGATSVIRIIDNGPGIAKEYLPQLGQAFFTTKTSGGTGLGLAVSYQIMAQHGGRVNVESVPGEGTMFTLEFPELSRRTVRISMMTA